MQDVVREACEAVQAAAPKGRAAIRRMLTVVAATADIRVTSRGLLPAAVRVVPDRSGPGGPRSSRDAGTDLSGPAYLGHSIVRRLPERVLGSFWRASAVWCGWH